MIITEEMPVLPEGGDLAQEESKHDGWCENWDFHVYFSKGFIILLIVLITTPINYILDPL